MNRENTHRLPLFGAHGWRMLNSVPAAHAQRGVALVVAMLLLIIVALVGLAAVRGTVMQQKMASNLYDREQAFQAAEAAMRVATAVLPTAPGEVSRNCQAGGVVCLGNPFTDPNLPTGSIYTVGTGTTSTTFTASATAAAQPQYVIEFMGNYVDPNSSGWGDTANSVNYGVQGSNSTAVYYRITARSGDPAVVGDRAVVTLQSTLKQG